MSEQPETTIDREYLLRVREEFARAKAESSALRRPMDDGTRETTNPVVTYDFTAFGCEPEAAIELLRKYCKIWDFQQEKTSTDRLHLQGRFHLKVKERLVGVAKKFPGWHLSVTSKASRNDAYYVTKEDTRVAGPWSSADPEPAYIPRHIRRISELRPWQQYIVDHAKDDEERTVNVIVDTAGNIGKSTLASYCGSHGLGRMLPFCNDFRDLSRMVMDTPTSNLYLIDMPKAIKKDKLAQFYAGIEQLKNGYAFDDRYAFREKYFDNPMVWVFTNTVPDFDLLSADRWKLWSIVDDQLCPFVTTVEVNPLTPNIRLTLNVRGEPEIMSTHESIYGALVRGHII